MRVKAEVRVKVNESKGTMNVRLNGEILGRMTKASPSMNSVKSYFSPLTLAKEATEAHLMCNNNNNNNNNNNHNNRIITVC